jgi:hypothetical protein
VRMNRSSLAFSSSRFHRRHAGRQCQPTVPTHWAQPTGPTRRDRSSSLICRPVPQRRATHETAMSLADRPRQNGDGGGAGQIAPLARRDGVTVQGPTVRLCYQGMAGRHGQRDAAPRRYDASPGLPSRPGPAAGPFACGVPGAVRGTWALSRGLDVDERPVSRERLLRRGAYSH